MGDFIKTQNSFADGEVAPEFYASDNIKGLSKLLNMDVLSGGGLTRRPGLKRIDSLSQPARLIPFSVAEDEEYIIALTNYHMYIYHNGVKIQDIITAWPYDAVHNIQYAHRFSTMIFVHPDYKPYVIQKESGIFKIAEFSFQTNDADLSVNIPFVKFDDAVGVTITISGSEMGNNYELFTTNKSFWTPDSVGSVILLMGLQWRIVRYIDPTQVIAYVNATFERPKEPVTDWYESAFGTRRGWPCSIAFHQDRLVFGGTHSWPGGIWMSCVGQHRNFNAGTGLDDEAIFVSLLSQHRQQIHTIVSSDNLQILTNSGEWAISSNPLTPSSIDVKQHTTVGSYMARYLPPQKIEGATIFVSGNGNDIRQLTLDELGEYYNANDLCRLSKHLISQPVDIAYNKISRQLFIVQENGKMAVLNQNSALGISAWGTYETAGLFLSVAVCDGKAFAMVQRQDKFFLECFAAAEMKDSNDYDFSFVASSLPMRASGHNVRKLRVRKISARVLDTKSISINQNYINLPNDIYAPGASGFTGDVSINLLGASSNGFDVAWTIHGNDALPATVLTVTIYGTYSV
ncbi:MAG: hypothetical protein J6R99_00200 [Alphaproteobacteria bacterium]|nr:hypothetical protein [Alphaproteobacteria bacterium]